MTVIVCGGRTYRNLTHVSSVLDSIHEKTPITLVIEGGADGADTCARLWAIQRDVNCDTYKAQWAKFGKGAGPIRNQQMLDEGKPDLVVAFPGMHGTIDMMNRAHAAGVRVLHVALEESRGSA